VRLSGVYLAMLTSPSPRSPGRSRSLGRIHRRSNAWLHLAGAWLSSTARITRCACSILRMRDLRALAECAHAFGYALRASKHSALRAGALASMCAPTQRLAFSLAAPRRALPADVRVSKGSISPETVSVQRSVDGLVMVLLAACIPDRRGVGPPPASPGCRTRWARSLDYWAPPSAS